MMKNRFWRIWPWSAALVAVAIMVCGCQKGQTTTNGAWTSVATPALTVPVSVSPTPAETPAAPETNEPSAQAPETEPPRGPGTPVAPEVYEPVPEYSVGLQEIVRMAESGISEAVMLSYITNTTQVYNLTSEEIIFLHDLGISSTVITALIEADNNPNAVALKKEAASFKPLPEEAVLTEPAPGIHAEVGDASNKTQSPNYPEDMVAGAELQEAAGTVAAATAPPGPVETYQPAPGEPLPEEVSDFYEPLQPYGNWYYVPDYGYCWQPTVAVVNHGWRPYADSGRWLWTSSGWYWYSDYTWGWAPFHYGRWSSYPSLGWIWVPDRVWGPSWVSWRYTKYYCGWAPLPPRCSYVSGVGLFYNGFSVGASFGFGFGYDYYTFIPLNRFYDRHPHHHYVSHHHRRSIFRDSTVVNNYFFGDNNRIVNHGVGLERISRLTRREIQRVRIDQTPSTPNQYSRREQFDPARGTLSVAAPPLRDGSSPVERATFRTSSRRLRDAVPSESASGAVRNSRAATTGGNPITLGTNPTGGGARGGLPSAVSRGRPFVSGANNRDNDRSPGSRTSRTGSPSGATADRTATPDSSPSPTLARPQFSRGSRSGSGAGTETGPAASPNSNRGRVVPRPSPSSIRIQTSPPTPSSRTFRVYPDGTSRSRSSLGVYSPSAPSEPSLNSRSPRIVMPSAPAPTPSSPSVGAPPISRDRGVRGNNSYNQPTFQGPSKFSPPPVSAPRAPSRSLAPTRSGRSGPAGLPAPSVAPRPSRSSPSVRRSRPRSAPRVSSPSRGNAISNSGSSNGRSSRSQSRRNR